MYGGLFSEGFDHDEVRKNKPPISDLHLQMPLTLHEIDTIYNHCGKCSWIKQSSKALRKFEETLDVRVEHPEGTFGNILGKFLSQVFNPIYNPIDEYPIWNICYQDQIDWMRRTWKNMNYGLLEFEDLEELPMLTDHIKHCLSVRERAERCAQYSALINSKRSHMVPKDIPKVADFYEYELTFDCTIYISNNCLILEWKHQYVLMNHNMLLSIVDILSARTLTLVTCYVGTKMSPLVYPPPRLVYTLYTWGDQILKIFGNHGYAIIKNIEGVMVGALQMLGEEDKVCEQDSFLSSALDAIFEYLPQDHAICQQLRNVLNTLLESSPHWTSQLCGLFRHFGHPLVRSQDGLHKIKRLGLRKKPCNHLENSKVTGEFKRLVITNYLRRHRKWPKLNIIDLPEESEIRRAYLANRDVDVGDTYYKESEWVLVKGEKNFPVPEGFNWASVLSDKSHSPLMNEFVDNVKRGRYDGRSIGKRLLLSWLQENFPTPPDLLQRINDEGFYDNELLLGVRPKEREMKIKPRMFAQLPLHVRLYFVITEQMIGDNILKNLGITTMKDSYIDLVKRMFAMSASQGERSDTIVCVVNIDFMTWNTELRQEMCGGVFKFIDELHGYENLVSRTHEFFTRSLIYLADGSGVFDVDRDGNVKENEYCYRGHLGGLEGIRQKGWTAYTGSLLSMIANKYKIKIKIMGQGDNQVLACHFKASRFDDQGNVLDEEYARIKRELNAFMDELEWTCSQVGMNIKREETWISSKLFAYGKQLFLHGSPLSMGLKRICRASHMTNDSYPSLNNSLQVICTSAEGMCMNDYTPFMSILIGQTEMRRCIATYMEFDITIGKGYKSLKGRELSFTYNVEKSRVVKMISENQLQEALSKFDELCNIIVSTGASIGGFNIIIPYEFLTRGFPDPVTCQYAQLLALLDSDLTEHERFWILNILRPIFKEKVDYFMLFSDPVSINIENSRKEDNVMKTFVKNLLETREYQRNDHFRIIMQNANVSNEKVITYLSTMAPLKPRIAADILDATPMGYALSIMHRFERTSTLIGKAYDDRGDDIADALAKCSREGIIAFIYQLYTFNPMLDIPTCSSVHAQTIRELSWDRPDIQDVTVAHPTEVFGCFKLIGNRCTNPNCKSDRIGYIEIRVDEAIQRLGRTGLQMKLGPSTPYLGSGTSEKQQGGKIVKVTNLDPIISKPIRIQRLIPFAVEQGTYLAIFIMELVRLITDADPSLFSDSTIETSGSVGHRYKDTYTKHGGYSNNLYTTYTWLHICTTTLERYSRGQANFNLHFQNTLSSHQEFVVMNLLSSKENSRTRMYHLHQVCQTCLTLMPENFVDTLEPHPPTIFKDVILDTYMWVSKEDLQLVYPLILDLKARSSVGGEGTEFFRQHLSYRIGQEAYNIGKNESKSNIMTTVQRISNVPMIWFMKCSFSHVMRGFLDEMIIKTIMRINLTSSYDSPDNMNIMRFIEANIMKLSPVDVMVLIPGYIMRQNQANLQAYQIDMFKGASFDLTAPSIAKTLKQILLQMFCEHPFWNDSLSFPAVLEPNPGTVSIDTVLRGVYLKYILSREKTITLNIPELGQLLSILYIAWQEYTKACEFFNEYPSLNEFLVSEILMNKVWGTFPPETITDIMTYIVVKQVVYISTGTLDSLSKNLSEPPNVLVPFTQFTMDKSKAAQLPDACIILNVSSKELVKTDATSPSDNIPLRNMSLPVETLLKYNSISTTAHYKFMGIINACLKMKLLQQVKTVGCFGDGTGGTVFLAHRLFNPNLVFFNTYLDIGNWIPQSLSEISCPVLDHYPNYRVKTIGLDLMRNGYSDFTDLNYYEILKEYLINNHISTFDLVTCDAETDMSTHNIDLIYAYSIWRICQLLSSDGVVIMKIYATNEVTVLNILGMYRILFTSVWIMRSFFSNKGNTELYVVASGKKGLRQTLTFEQATKIMIRDDAVRQLISECSKLHLTSHIANQYNALITARPFEKKVVLIAKMALHKFHVPVSLAETFDSDIIRWFIRSAIHLYRTDLLKGIMTHTTLGNLTQDVIDRVGTQLWILLTFVVGGIRGLNLLLKSDILDAAIICYLSTTNRQLMVIIPNKPKNQELINRAYKISMKSPLQVILWRVKQIKLVEKIIRETLSDIAALQHVYKWEGQNYSEFSYQFKRSQDKERQTKLKHCLLYLGGNTAPSNNKLRKVLSRKLEL